ncbi:MAG: 16S rRNA (adenine(1518)-N(6)/adenine(1519)-N(6))-dimethyltransferase RsmA [Pseudomonadota bacterium]|nr:16S rRNA (adenine(1518)-N(6)/adenine(1519)-N(6))-dimethyltransferase RsmA [Pseudomonadota bacterium]MEC7830614.1 16S rRNA (adenine(1518)-N(6)/adenine(1519)-N(6))-dimethyltransferase RsmA [Pseudomonadota bacterium]MEC9382582.1 16S rRNA (adenine(1518)-N(6)/adenine(1519)-N(6))-dimethyltransferase RsmA [Pseudomonadota bacterium]MEC9481338.1 16S rRNA (adenine(1518)-N(6)/adenine(1519)-N(6))-dimethyltransferase RsmA [Pseudomonadota bacterium]
MNINNKLSLKNILDEYDFRPKKKLGQNFLHDKNIIESIIKEAKIKGENILEVGPGPAILTELMLMKGANLVLSIEKDDSFEKKLSEIKKKYEKRFSYIFADILDYNFDKNRINNFKIISNLPYNISVPFILKMNKENYRLIWKEMILMVQKEVADRLLAVKGAKNYGRISVIMGWKNKIERIFNVKPSSFIPKPKVDSSLIRITPLMKYPDARHETLEKIIKLSFSHKRKTIKNNLDQLNIDTNNLLDLAKINPSERAENIEIEDFCRIANLYEKITS